MEHDVSSNVEKKNWGLKSPCSPEIIFESGKLVYWVVKTQNNNNLSIIYLTNAHSVLDLQCGDLMFSNPVGQVLLKSSHR